MLVLRVKDLLNDFTKALIIFSNKLKIFNKDFLIYTILNKIIHVNHIHIEPIDPLFKTNGNEKNMY